MHSTLTRADRPYSPETARHEVEEALWCVAPTADLDTIEPDDPIWPTLHLDPDDHELFVEALVRRTGLRIERDDHPRLATLESATAFLVVVSRTRDLL